MQATKLLNINNIKSLSYICRHSPVTGSLGLPLSIPLETLQHDIKGFGVRVHPTGRKVYIVKYRHEGRSVKVTIGPHGPITPAAARAKAAEIVTLAKTGRDVVGRTPRSKGSATMAELARRFMEDYAPAHLKPNTARLYRKIIDNRILPGSASAASAISARATPSPFITTCATSPAMPTGRWACSRGC